MAAATYLSLLVVLVVVAFCPSHLQGKKYCIATDEQSLIPLAFSLTSVISRDRMLESRLRLFSSSLKCVLILQPRAACELSRENLIKVRNPGTKGHCQC